MNNIGGYHIAKERGVYSGPAPAKPAPKRKNPVVLRPPMKAMTPYCGIIEESPTAQPRRQFDWDAMRKSNLQPLAIANLSHDLHREE